MCVFVKKDFKNKIGVFSPDDPIFAEKPIVVTILNEKIHINRCIVQVMRISDDKLLVEYYEDRDAYEETIRWLKRNFKNY